MRTFLFQGLGFLILGCLSGAGTGVLSGCAHGGNPSSPEGSSDATWVSWQREMAAQNHSDPLASCQGIDESSLRLGHPAGMDQKRQVIESLLRDAKPYTLLARGEGSGHLVSLPWEGNESTNCTEAMDRFLSHSYQQDLSLFRYGVEQRPAFFRRLHFYETLWRPNVMRVAGVTEVAKCLSARFEQMGCRGLLKFHTFEVRGEDWRELIRSQIIKNEKLTPETRKGAEALIGEKKLATLSAREQGVFGSALERDWSGSSLELEARVRVIQGALSQLDQSPVLVRLEVLSFSDWLLCPQWQKALVPYENRIFLVGLIHETQFAHKKREMVTHQGALLFEKGEWFFLHASRQPVAGLPRGGLRKERFVDFLKRSQQQIHPRLVGLDLLLLPE